MTLFDRKVDLALFSSDTPLYIMCREWMSNNPEKFRSVPPHNHTNSLTPSQPNTVTDPTTPTSTTIPPPTPLEKDEKGRTIRMDVPSPQKQHLSKTEFDDRLHKVRIDSESNCCTLSRHITCSAHSQFMQIHYSGGRYCMCSSNVTLVH